MTDPEAVLRARLDELLARYRKIGARRSETAPVDSEEQALAREGDEVLDRLDEAERAQIGALRAALDRAATGTYGVCVRCHGRIDAKRLAALPTAELCGRCAGV